MNIRLFFSQCLFSFISILGMGGTNNIFLSKKWIKVVKHWLISNTRCPRGRSRKRCGDDLDSFSEDWEGLTTDRMEKFGQGLCPAVGRQ